MELIDQAEHPELSFFVGPPLDEVVGPDMIGPTRPQAYARAVVQPFFLIYPYAAVVSSPAIVGLL